MVYFPGVKTHLKDNRIWNGSWRTVISDKLAALLAQAKENKLSWDRTIAYIEATMQSKGIDIRNWDPTYQFKS
jgi:hypothetical protein